MTDPLAPIFAAIQDNEPYYRLVERFYGRVDKDPVLRPLYPLDLTEPKKHLAQFLIQRTGGEQTYCLERGHPRMRARHLPFKIGEPERDACVKNMSQAVLEVPEFEPFRDTLNEFFSSFATFLINHP